MEKENKSEKVFSKGFCTLIIVICLLLISFTVVGFFFFSKKDDEVIEQTESGGSVTLNYSSDVNGLSIINAVPITSAIGMSGAEESQYFDFSVDVNLDNAKSVEYEIYIEKVASGSTISDEDIRIYLEKEKSGTYNKEFDPMKFSPLKKATALGAEKGSMVLGKVKKTKSGVDNYRLRMWLADNSLTPTGNYSVLVNVVGEAK